MSWAAPPWVWLGRAGCGRGGLLDGVHLGIGVAQDGGDVVAGSGGGDADTDFDVDGDIVQDERLVSASVMRAAACSPRPGSPSKSSTANSSTPSRATVPVPDDRPQPVVDLDQQQVADVVAEGWGLPLWCASTMGYGLPVTRALNWHDAAIHPIGRQEWNDYPRGHPAMVEDGWIDWAAIGREPGYAWPRSSSAASWLSWRGGEVVVTGAVEDMEALVSIAESLGANLIGDDNARYTRESWFD